jgi:hypothetical protein
MRPIQYYTVSFGVLALFAIAGSAAGQQAPGPVLPAPQVRELMASQQPADHAKLRGHFDGLAAKYAADADRHMAFARASAAVPRGAGAAAATHHTRLAESARESASIVRELAVHHRHLAAGVLSTAPRDGERFEKGVGAPAIPSEQQLLDLAAKAQKPSEHGLLSEYYTTLAARYAADAQAHRAMAQGYRGLNRPDQSTIGHCDRLAQLSDDSAGEAQALATEHKHMAGSR